MNPVTVSQAELRECGYTEITHQSEDGEVILRDESGHLEVFRVMDYSSHSVLDCSLSTEDGRYLNFVRAVVHDEGLSTHH